MALVEVAAHFELLNMPGRENWEKTNKTPLEKITKFWQKFYTVINLIYF